MFTIITTNHAFTIDGDRYARDGDGDVHVYADDETTLTTVDADAFEAVARGTVDVTHPRPDH